MAQPPCRTSRRLEGRVGCDGQAASVNPIRCATPVPPGGALQPGFSGSPDRIAPPTLMLRGDPKVGIVGISQQIVNTKAKGCEGPSSRYVSWTEAFTTAPGSASGIAGFAASDHLLKLRSAERDRILNLVTPRSSATPTIWRRRWMVKLERRSSPARC
jgi:hypothetical protein